MNTSSWSGAYSSTGATLPLLLQTYRRTLHDIETVKSLLRVVQCLGPAAQQDWLSDCLHYEHDNVEAAAFSDNHYQRFLLPEAALLFSAVATADTNSNN